MMPKKRKEYAPDPPAEMLERGFAASGTTTKRELAFFVFKWAKEHINPPITRDVYGGGELALKAYLASVEGSK